MLEINIVKFYDCPFCNTRSESLEEGFESIRQRARETIFKCKSCKNEVKINSGWYDNLPPY